MARESAWDSVFVSALLRESAGVLDAMGHSIVVRGLSLRCAGSLQLDGGLQMPYHSDILSGF